MSGVMDRLREVAERHAQRPRRAFEETMLVLDSLVGDVHAIEKMTSESEGLVWDEVAYEAAKSLFHPGNIDGVHASAAAALNPSVSAKLSPVIILVLKISVSKTDWVITLDRLSVKI